MAEQKPLALFAAETPLVADAFDEVIKAISALDGLDNKTRQLIYIGIKASQGDLTAVRAHTPMAKSAGATREEIRDTIVLTLAVSGVKGIVTCLPGALDIYDNC